MPQLPVLHDFPEQQKSNTIAIKIIKQQLPPKKLLLELEHEQQLVFINIPPLSVK